MTSAIPISPGVMHFPSYASSAHSAAHDLHKNIARAFVTALLLTASAERAEAAILKGTKVDLGAMPAEALLRGIVTAALEPQYETLEQPPEQLEHASHMLPIGLRHVLHLSTDLRHCFVLRVLVGLPREICARLLRVDAGQIDERTCTAMLELPAVQRNRP
jgi:hypothetical protein